MTRTALITGVTGQDGSYLAELLLEKGYRVVGMVRRASTENFSRVAHLRDRLELTQADLLDQSSMVSVLSEVRPDEVYNLAAQSFVPTSWAQPVLTSEFTALGVTRLLEAIRHVDPKIRFYQASSSEMFGKVRETPQNERTPFYPRSPYGVAKVYGHFITVNYRESYGLYAVSGIQFNHECVAADTPLLVREQGAVNVVTPDELVPLRRNGPSQQSFAVAGLEVWDGSEWSPVRTVTATRRRKDDADHALRWVEARGGVVLVTGHHRMLDADGGEVSARDVVEGMHLALAGAQPPTPGWTTLSPELAELLGLLTAEGHEAVDGHIQFTNTDPALRERVGTLWSKLFLGTSAVRFTPSGWDSSQSVGQLYLNGGNALRAWLRQQLYHRSGLKRVPRLVLNATPEIQRSFLCGYHAGDGLRAGHGDSVKTNSPLLAQGLYWLYAVQGRPCSVYAEHRDGRTYYQLSISTPTPVGEKGQHLRRPASEVRRVRPCGDDDEWVFDLETECGVFCAGVGRIVVHNSPRRGLEFVTRKVTDGAARIALGLAETLPLGNLEAERDWGFAGDYVRAMWLMLQQSEPDDFVVATGVSHSVRQLVEIAFGCAGLDWRRHVTTDPKLVRPAEVDKLRGDASKARARLGWRPEVSFEAMIEMMVRADLERLRKEHGASR
jgi:GDPmannose 4,6-dehydratase